MRKAAKLGLIERKVLSEPNNFGVRTIARPAIAALLILTWLFVGALSVSPALHQKFHQQAASSDHLCAVTLLEHGKVAAAGSSAVLVVAISLGFFFKSIPQQAKLPSLDLQLSFGRAPPCFFSPR